MVLWIKMAFKKLINNKRKTVNKVLFFGTIFSIVFSLNMFLHGTQKQMNSANKNSNGDVKFLNKKEKDSLIDTYNYVKDKYGDELEGILPGLTLEADINSSSSYVKGKCIGATEDFYNYISDGLGWIQESKNPLKAGYAILEASLAQTLNVNNGDYITLRYVEDESGAINTADIEVDGIFTGNKLIYENTIITNIEDLRLLKMEDGAINRLRLYFTNTNEERMRSVAGNIKKENFRSVKVESATLDPEGGIMGIFSYYKMLIGFILSMIIFIFIIILNFSNQNIFFMEFRSRKAEISTLLTYGIKIREIRLIVLFETLFVFLFSLVISLLLVNGIIGALSFIEMNTMSLSDIITVIGGPKLIFSFNSRDISLLTGILLAIFIYSGQKGAGNYLKMEIKEIITTSV